MLTKAEKVAIEAAFEQIHYCTLCGSEPDMKGVWVPSADVSRKLGAPRGKLRIVAYGLCTGCHEQPGCVERVEKRLIAEQGYALPTPSAN